MEIFYICASLLHVFDVLILQEFLHKRETNMDIIQTFYLSSNGLGTILTGKAYSYPLPNTMWSSWVKEYWYIEYSIIGLQGNIIDILCT